MSDGVEWLGVSLDQSMDLLAGGLGRGGNVIWHVPFCAHAVEFITITYVNTAVGRTENVQFKINFLQHVANPAHGQNYIDINHGIDEVEAGRPIGAAGHDLDKGLFEYARARMVG